MAAVNVRDGVLSVLMLVNEEQIFLDEALARVAGEGSWTDDERRLLTRLAKGTIERQIEIDYRIDHAASVFVRKMKPEIRNILRFSVYSLLYMDHMPVHAVVNEAVELTKLRAPKELAGFVNGVLREIARGLEPSASGNDSHEADMKPRPDPVVRPGDGDSRKTWVRRASLYYSVPTWIIRNWVRDYGREVTEEMLEGLYSERPLTARTNRTRISRDGLLELWRAAGIECESAQRDGQAGSSSAIRFRSDRPVEQMPGYAEGYFYVQDMGSMRAGAVAPVKAGDRILDLCAAPGGKATHMAERLIRAEREAPGRERGHVLACDISEAKLPLIRENARRLRLDNITCDTLDARVFRPEWEEKWDVVIADVPCSGLGVIGHKPDIKMRLTREDVDSLIGIQREILDNAVRYVKPGGYLVYSTCTVWRDENDRQVERVLEEYPQMEPGNVLAEISLSEELRASITREDMNHSGMIQLLPGIHDSDGFFVALLRRQP